MRCRPHFHACRGGGRGRGSGRRLLNRGMGGGNSGNFITRRGEGGEGGPSSAPDAVAAAAAREAEHVLDGTLGFPLYTDGPERLGWLMNLGASTRQDRDSGQTLAVVNCYFMCQVGGWVGGSCEGRVGGYVGGKALLAPVNCYFVCQVCACVWDPGAVGIGRGIVGVLRSVRSVGKALAGGGVRLSQQRSRRTATACWQLPRSSPPPAPG